MTTPHQHLEALLGDLFPTTDELRRHLRHGPGGTELVDNVPETGAPAQLRHDLVRALNAAGLLDRAFFERLEQLRPGRVADIREVAVAWGIDRTGRPGGATPSPTRSAVWLVGLTLVAVVIALVWWSRTDPVRTPTPLQQVAAPAVAPPLAIEEPRAREPAASPEGGLSIHASGEGSKAVGGDLRAEADRVDIRAEDGATAVGRNADVKANHANVEAKGGATAIEGDAVFVGGK